MQKSLPLNLRSHMNHVVHEAHVCLCGQWGTYFCSHVSSALGLQRGSEAACPAERRDPCRPLGDARCRPAGTARAVLILHTSTNVLQLCCREAGVGVPPGGQAAVLPLVEKACCSCVWILESFWSGGQGEGTCGWRICKEDRVLFLTSSKSPGHE